MESSIELVPEFCGEIIEPTVILRNVCKYYGSKNNRVNVLQNLDLTVPKGVIYALLGSSGCGKTTLLNCIVGRRAINSGKIWVLGGVPGSKNSRVPGPEIGYMPQAVGVQLEFTTRETMQYFGKVAGLNSQQIKERIAFLEKLLMLPDVDKRLENVSGGEQRRISFAVALIHEPELLILDEPTVGLDPLLRESIWNYLYDITAQGKTTVILTTHYIDEARHANMVALLREGTLLSEEAPNTLMSKLSVDTLEEAFFKLSTIQRVNISTKNTLHFLSENIDYDSFVEKHNKNTTRSRKSTNSGLKPHLRKNMQWLLKNPFIVILTIAVPILQLILFHVAIGHDPVKITFAISNSESSLKNCSNVTCNSENLSCHFLQYLQTTRIDLVYYNSEDEAIETVFRGKADASISFRHNYSLALKKRVQSQQLSHWDIEYWTIDVMRDVTTYNVAQFTKATLLKKYNEFIGDYLESCGNSRNLLSLPIKWNDPIYGKSLPDFAEFAVPALVLNGVTFFASWAITSSVITEKKCGLTDRLLVMGVNPIHLLFTHFIIECVLLSFHMASVISFVYGVMKLTLIGNIILVILMFVLMALWGVSFGIFLATACTSDALASYTIVGTFFPAGVLSGFLWPVEGMPYVIRKIADVVPFSGIANSMRSISQRGWDLSHSELYTSVICVFLWILVFLLISIAIAKLRKH